MRVCFILEGCYPYVFGGVSSWTHHYIEAMPDVEFVLWCIGSKEELKGKYKFQLPKNVVEIHEVFLDTALEIKMDKRQRKHPKITKEEREEMQNLFAGNDVNWDVLFNLFQEKKMNPTSLLMSQEFLNLLIEKCREKYPYISFSNYFFNVRSMLLPELYLMTTKVPEADIYHTTATGYSGILGSMAKWKYKKPMIVTEHGIYTREREEELLGAKWVLPYLRKQWIEIFYRFSACAYEYADRVTALFNNANKIQAAIGCPVEKLSVIENGINYDNFKDIPVKADNGYIDIGAVVRIAKIKDIKTMIYAFAEVKSRVPNARLYILGDVDDKEYNEECHQLIDQLKVEDIIFTGVVSVKEYFPKFDFTILTSISEGQPLSVLESFAAGRPVVTTDVGCCRELIDRDDEFGSAGLCVPPMHKDLLADAMVSMCLNKGMRLKMGESGRLRAEKYYTQKIMMDKYRSLYEEVVKK